MINDNETNFLYLSDMLPIEYPEFYKEFERILKKHKIHFELIPATRDIWCGDYMPIQLSKSEFVQFKYEPIYLMETRDGRESISDTTLINASLQIKPVESAIKIDGGNIVKHKNKAILTTRIFEENENYNEFQLLDEIKALLKVEQLIIIPEYVCDEYGHADGLVRFIDEKNVLINSYVAELDQPSYIRTLKMALYNAGLTIHKLPYNPYENLYEKDAKGIYINYLEMRQVIVMPTFGLDEDKAAYDCLSNIFPAIPVETIDCSELAQEGGLLNCITWNIKK
ncbi:MAG: hypothetical protein COC01_06805 [Bacteroidetes bacterium]|nr:MAG: hypothetical protein COC01_06805 [Bacteroidota bacterium]